MPNYTLLLCQTTWSLHTKLQGNFM